MTEDEAKTKWCCGAPAIVSQAMDQAAGNTTGREPLKCIGSACMAWRWAMEPNPAYVEQGNVWPDTRQPQEKLMMLPGRERGFCGLAGRPA